MSSFINFTHLQNSLYKAFSTPTGSSVALNNSMLPPSIVTFYYWPVSPIRLNLFCPCKLYQVL